MVKELIKKQIRKTGTYRVIEIELEKSKDQIQTLQKDKQNLNQEKNILQNDKLHYRSLVNNLRNENSSIKQILIDKKNLIKDSDFSKLTIIIPYRKVADQDRENNLDINLKYLNNIGIPNIIISEHSDSSSEAVLIDSYQNLFKNFKVIWIDAKGELFNKSLAINKAVLLCKTPYFATFDMDCLTRKDNINMAINLLDQGFEIVHPFDRKVQDIIDKQGFIEDYDFKTIKTKVQIRLFADGGLVFWNKSSFIKIGMQNEYFSGWGGEDNEIMLRADLFNLKHYRINDVLYHLYHKRDKKRSKNNFNLEEKTRQLQNREECLKEISKWPWVVENKELSQ